MNSLFARLLRSYIVVILTAIMVTGAALSYLYSDREFERTERELVRQGERIALFFAISSTVQPTQVTANAIQATAEALGVGITIADRRGAVVMTTTNMPAQRLNLRPQDIERVLVNGEIVTRRGFEEALGEAAVTALIPIRRANVILGAVVLHTPSRGVIDTLRNALNLLFLAALLAACAAIAVSYVLSRRIVAPIRAVTEATKEVAEGNFDRRVPATEPGELGELSNAFNELASRLGTTIGELWREKQKTSSILESMDEGVVAVDRAGGIILANPALRRLAAPGTAEGPLRAHPALSVLWPLFERALKGEPVPHSEVRIGDSILSVHVTPLKDERGEVQGAVAILHDITERYRLERMRRDFLANVSHELRTPLTSIRGFAQAILEGMVSGEEQGRRYLRVIMDESMRLIRLVNTILDLSRIEANAIPLNIEPLDIAEVISDAADSLEPLCRDRGIEIELDCGPAPIIHGDRDRLTQVVQNLLDNAVRHAPKGTKVTVRTGPVELADEPGVRIDIEDRGEGIPPEDLPYIWERFYKVDKSRKYERGVGTGLGLVIVKEIVQMHKGRVRAANLPEGGTRFTVELPRGGEGVAKPEGDGGPDSGPRS